MTSTVDASSWFDQLEPVNPPGFEGRFPSWCRRHYAPAVRCHGNQLGASAELTGITIGLIRQHLPADIHVTITTATIVAARDMLGPWCCIAGDQRMYAIWSRWADMSVENAARL